MASGGEPEAVEQRPRPNRILYQCEIVAQRVLGREGLDGPGPYRDERYQKQREVRQQQQAREPPSRDREPASRPGTAHRNRSRRRSLLSSCRDLAGATRQQPQGGERHHGERDRLHHRELVFAVQPGGDDLRRHHPEATAKDVGGAERRERRHEREKRSAGQRGIEVRQHHAPERAPPAGTETGRRLVLRGVERGEGCAHEEIEVDVHRVSVHQEDRTGTLEPPRWIGETERALDQQRDEPGLPVEEQERDDPYERREYGRQCHQGAQAPDRPGLRSGRRERPAESRPAPQAARSQERSRDFPTARAIPSAGRGTAAGSPSSSPRSPEIPPPERESGDTRRARRATRASRCPPRPTFGGCSFCPRGKRCIPPPSRRLGIMPTRSPARTARGGASTSSEVPPSVRMPNSADGPTNRRPVTVAASVPGAESLRRSDSGRTSSTAGPGGWSVLPRTSHSTPSTATRTPAFDGPEDRGGQQPRAADEAADEQIGRLGVQLVGRAHLFQPPRPQHGDPVA